MDLGDAEDITEVSLEELLGTVVTASKAEQPLHRAPANIVVLEGEALRAAGHRSLGDALRYVEGLAIIDDLVDVNLGVRGLFAGTGAGSDFIKLMINGQPVSFRPTSANSFSRDFLPIEAIDRVELIRGPASALYGANALLGVINVITYDGPNEEQAPWRQSLTLEGELSQNPAELTAGGGASFVSTGSWEALRYFFAGSYHRADRSGLYVPGLDDMVDEYFQRLDPSRAKVVDGMPSPAWDAPTRQGLLRAGPSANDIAHYGSLYAVATLDLDDWGELALDGSFQLADRYGEFQDESALSHAHRLTKQNGFARLRWQQSDAEALSWLFTMAVSAGAPTDDERLVVRAEQDSYQQHVMSSLAFDLVAEGSYAISEGYSIRLGLDYSHDFEDLMSLESVDKRTGERRAINGYGDMTFINVGSYLQAELGFLEQLSLTLGTRLDYNSGAACERDAWDCIGSAEDKLWPTPEGTQREIGGRGLLQVSNRAALVGELPWLGLYGKLLYGSSYKPPSPYQLFHTALSNTSTVGNPALSPQTADTAELLVGMSPLPGLSLSLNGYYTQVNDIVLFFKEAATIRPRNADVRLIGLETSLAYKSEHFDTWLNATWKLDASTTPLQREDETDFAWETSVFNDEVDAGMFPDWIANTGVALRLPQQHLRVHVALQVLGPRNASLTNNQLFDSLSLQRSYALDPYVRADIELGTLGLSLFDGRETAVSIAARNLPGQHTDPGFGGVDIPSLGAQLLLRLSQEL